MGQQALQLVVGGRRLDELDQLDLIELLHAHEGARVAAIGPGLAAEAGRVARQRDGQRVAFENLRNAAVARYMERRTASAELPDVLDLTQSALMSVEVQPGDEVEKHPAPVHAAGIG